MRGLSSHLQSREAIKTATDGRFNDDKFFGAVVIDGFARRGPGGSGEIEILLKFPTGGRRRPGDDGGVGGGEEDSQCRRVSCLERIKSPEPTRERVIAPGQRTAGVVLADGTAQGILTIGAGTTAVSDFEPIDGVGLGGGRQSEDEGNCEGEEKCEDRNSKFETSSKIEIRITQSDFLGLRILDLSDFEFRARYCFHSVSLSFQGPCCFVVSLSSC